MRASSLTPFVGASTVTRSLTSWYASRSEVATSTGARPRLRGSREEVVRLVARRLRDEEAELLAHGRQQRELLEQRLLEDAAGLVRLVCLVAVRRRLERVPADEHGARPLGLPEPHHHVREADDGVQRDRLRQAVVGAVGERVAVDGEERAQSDSSSSRIFAISRSVASAAASPSSRPRRSSIVDGRSVGDADLPEPKQLVGSRDRGGHERDAGLERDPRGAGARARLEALDEPLRAPRPLGEHRDRVAFAREAHGGLDRGDVALARGGPEMRRRRSG